MKALAKITRPSSAGIFPRRRLFRRLDHARNHHPVIFVTGPPGSGKTSLITSYLKERQLPCLWYQVDASDGDIASFFYYMGVAATRATSRRLHHLPLLTPEYLMGINTFTHRYFEELFSRLLPGHSSATKGKFVIVFDNYQQVPEESLFHKLITVALSRIPSGINVIIMSRNEHPPVFAPMLANRLMEIIGWDELKLQYEETKGIVRRLGHERIPNAILQEMHTKADGWAAGLVLVAQRAGKEPIESLFHPDHAYKEIFGYFAGEVLDNTEADTQAFLLKTAFFRRFTADMAKKLTRNPKAARILSDLNGKNYFIQRHAARTWVYQYHSLFREFLLTRAQENFRPDDLSRIRKRTARLCAAHGQYEDAVDLFLEAGDWGHATRLISNQAQVMTARGRGKTLAAWIETLPQSKTQQDPWLLYWKGMCQLPMFPSHSCESLEKAFRIFEAKRDSTGAFLSWCGIVRSFFHGWDDMKPLDPWIAWLDRRVRKKGSSLPLEIQARVAVHMVIALTHRKPGHADVHTWIEQALSLSKRQPDIGLRMQAYSYACFYYLWAGDHARVELLVEEATRLTGLPGASPLTVLSWKVVQIAYHGLTASTESTSALVSEALRMAESTGVHVLDFLLHSYAVASLLSGGDLARAAELLKSMESSIDANKRNSLSRCHLLAGWHALLAGNLPLAAVHAEKGVELTVETGLPYGEALNRLQMAHVLHLMGRHEGAAQQLRLARDIAARMRSSFFEWMCLLADAWFATDGKGGGLPSPSLREAMALGREKGFSNYEGLLPSVMRGLCLQALEHGIEVEYVQDLILKRRLIPDSTAYDCELWPWPVKVYTLGRLEVCIDGKPVQLSGKIQKKPLLLLKALIALGAREVKEERLADILWPEAEGDVAHQAFETTLHRLRKWFGYPDALQFSNGLAALDRGFCWTDIAAFERLVEQADANQKRGAAGGTVESVERAIALYKGAFLPGETEESWTVSLRERSRRKFLRCVSWLGRHWEGAGQWEKALACYERGLEVDNIAEEFYQRLMTCYHRLGRKAEAFATYARCRKILAAVLGVEPSSKTEAVRRSLL